MRFGVQGAGDCQREERKFGHAFMVAYANGVYGAIAGLLRRAHSPS